MGSNGKPFESLFDLESRLLLKTLDPHYQLTEADFCSIHWDHFLYVLECHRVTTHVYQSGKITPFLPPEIETRFREQNASIQVRMLKFMAELFRLLTLLQQNSIPAIALKGPVLGQLYYGNYAQRECNDLDILVRSSDHQAAYTILTERGYRLEETLWNSPKQEAVYKKHFHHYSLYHAEHHIQVELHWGLNALLYSDPGEVEALWSNSRFQRIGSLDIRVLSKYDNFLYLCIHGGAHHWKRLFWLLDIVQILKKENEQFMIEAYQKAVSKGVENYILLAYSLVNSLFRVSLPTMIQNKLHNEKKIKHIVTIVASFMQQTSVTDRNPIKDFSSFRHSIKQIINVYRSDFYLSGSKAVLASFGKFFINPRYWQLYSFRDQFFFLNYAAAPFLWVYSIINKYKR